MDSVTTTSSAIACAGVIRSAAAIVVCTAHSAVGTHVISTKMEPVCSCLIEYQGEVLPAGYFYYDYYEAVPSSLVFINLMTAASVSTLALAC